MATESDDLTTWINDLRGRVARGELDGQGEFAVLGGWLAIGLAARIMLADLDHDQDLTPEQRENSFSTGRRRLLFSDLHRLREQIG